METSPNNDSEKTKYEHWKYLKGELNRTIFIKICYIHSSERCIEPLVHYKFFNMPYRKVRILGQIVGKSKQTNSDLVIVVDDSTSEISCILTKDKVQEAEKKRFAIENELTTLKESEPLDKVSSQEKINFKRSSITLLSKTLEQLNISGYNTDYQLGSYVIIIGAVSEFHHMSVIYVHNIIKLSQSELLQEMKSHNKNCIAMNWPLKTAVEEKQNDILTSLTKSFAGISTR